MKNTFIETTRDGWRIALDISAYSLVAVSARIAPLMTDGGSIQTLTYLGSERVFPAYRVMGVAKAALEASVRYLAWDLGEQGYPGQCDLGRTDQDGGGPRHPRLHGHVQAPEREDPAQVRFHGRKVDRTLVFLASDVSAAITGEAIFVDNGYHAMGM